MEMRRRPDPPRSPRRHATRCHQRQADASVEPVLPTARYDNRATTRAHKSAPTKGIPSALDALLMSSRTDDGAGVGRRGNSRSKQDPKAASTSAVTRARQRRLLEEPALLFLEAGAQWRQRKEPETLRLAEAARARLRAQRMSRVDEPLVHSAKWLDPPPEFVEPKSTHLFEAIRARARHARLHELDEFGREPEAQPEGAAALPEPRKDGSTRATRRASRRASDSEAETAQQLAAVGSLAPAGD